MGLYKDKYTYGTGTGDNAIFGRPISSYEEMIRKQREEIEYAQWALDQTYKAKLDPKTTGIAEAIKAGWDMTRWLDVSREEALTLHKAGVEVWYDWAPDLPTFNGGRTQKLCMCDADAAALEANADNATAVFYIKEAAEDAAGKL